MCVCARASCDDAMQQIWDRRLSSSGVSGMESRSPLAVARDIKMEKSDVHYKKNESEKEEGKRRGTFSGFSHLISSITATDSNYKF